MSTGRTNNDRLGVRVPHDLVVEATIHANRGTETLSEFTRRALTETMARDRLAAKREKALAAFRAERFFCDPDPDDQDERAEA
jgi:hypothetical protein